MLEWIVFNKELILWGALGFVGGGFLWGMAEVVGRALMNKILRRDSSAPKDGG